MIDVFVREEQGLFIVKIMASTPALAPALRRPGQPVTRMSFEEPEKLQNPNRDVLEGLAKALLIKRYGKVLLFQERPA